MDLQNYVCIRNLTWKILTRYQINALPISTTHLANRMGIKVCADSEVSALQRKESGAAFYRNQTWIIVYNDAHPLTRCRFTIAHELGHLLLGHLADVNPTDFSFFTKGFKASVEREANGFAARLLAPACVLWGLHIHQGKDIARICQISQQAADIRAKRMEVLYQREKFLTHPLERCVFEQFQPFILSTLQHKEQN